MKRGLGVWGLLCVTLSLGCQGPQGSGDKGGASVQSQQQVGHRGAGDDALARRGFALAPSELQQPSGTLQVSFTAPVGPLGAPPGVSGTAQVTQNGATHTWQAVALVEDTLDPALVYAVFEDPAAPAQQLVVAARAADVTAGAFLALDGTQAALLLLDDVTGEASMGLAGTFAVTDANLAAGGSLVASLDVTLTPVTLAQWPEALFPLTHDGSATERAAGVASGAFALRFDDRDGAPGTASVASQVDGFAAFSADMSFGASTGDGYVQLYFLNANGAQRALVVVMEEALMVPGSIALGTYDAMAWQLEEDGTQIAFTAGTLTLDTAGTSFGADVQGSLELSGQAMVFRCEGDCHGPVEEPQPTEPQDCSALATLPDAFVASEAGIQEYSADEALPGYTRALLLVDGVRAAVFAALIPDTANLEAGVTLSLGIMEFEGSTFGNAVYALESCYDQIVEVESGTLTLTQTSGPEGARLLGEGTVTTGGVGRSLQFDLPLADWSAGIELTPRE